MEKYIYDHTNGWWYKLIDDYYLPCVHSEDPASNHLGNHLSLQTVNADPQTIGSWGMRHLTYLRTHSPSAYREFLRNGKLNIPNGNYKKILEISPKIFNIYQHVCYNKMAHSAKQ